MKFQPLSPQQKKLYFLLFQDLRMQEIAFEMGCHPKTVDAHAKEVYRKIGVSGRVGLILGTLAETKGVIPEIPLDLHRRPVLPSASLQPHSKVK